MTRLARTGLTMEPSELRCEDIALRGRSKLLKGGDMLSLYAAAQASHRRLPLGSAGACRSAPVAAATLLARLATDTFSMEASEPRRMLLIQSVEEAEYPETVERRRRHLASLLSSNGSDQGKLY